MSIRTATLIKIYKPKYLLGTLCLLFNYFFLSNISFAQNKVIKLSKEFQLNTFASLDLASSHTNIILSTWPKNTVEIIAYSHGEVSENILRDSNKAWDLEFNKSDSLLIVKTDASKQLPMAKSTNSYTNKLSKERFSNNNVSNSTITSVSHIWRPILSQTNTAELPEILKKQLVQSQFNFEAYRSLGEMYFKIWEYNLVKNSNRNNENLDRNSLAQLEKWYSQMTQSLFAASDDIQNGTISVSDNKNTSQLPTNTKSQSQVWNASDVNKTLEIKVPENMVTKLNANFGTVTLSNKLTNVIANLKYTTFSAKDIDGAQTNISIAAAPVAITKWQNGSLNLKYVKIADIGAINIIKLKAVSSKVNIANILDSGTFNGSFSQLKIENVNENITSLSFLNTNGDIELSLPNSAFHFAYSGEMSGIKIPPSRLTLKSLGDYRKLMLHGYSQSRNTDSSIQMNVIHSQVLLK